MFKPNFSELICDFNVTGFSVLQKILIMMSKYQPHICVSTKPFAVLLQINQFII